MMAVRVGAHEKQSVHGDLNKLVINWDKNSSQFSSEQLYQLIMTICIESVIGWMVEIEF